MAVPAEQIDREVEQRLRKLSRTVRMDGFRPGKVPLKIVAQHYGPQVRSEVIGDAVQKAFSEVVQEQKLKVAGYPRIERREGGDAKQLSFSATFEIYPEVKQKVMRALVDSTTLELPKSLVEIEMQRMVRQTRADLEARGVKLERLPVKPEALEGQARRRVALGLILAELVKSHELAAKPEQVRALVTEHAQTYEQPFEVVRWVYSEPQRLNEFEGLAVESNVVRWVLERAKVEDKAISFEELMGAAA